MLNEYSKVVPKGTCNSMCIKICIQQKSLTYEGYDGCGCGYQLDADSDSTRATATFMYSFSVERMEKISPIPWNSPRRWKPSKEHTGRHTDITVADIAGQKSARLNVPFACHSQEATVPGLRRQYCEC